MSTFLTKEDIERGYSRLNQGEGDLGSTHDIGDLVLQSSAVADLKKRGAEVLLGFDGGVVVGFELGIQSVFSKIQEVVGDASNALTPELTQAAAERINANTAGRPLSLRTKDALAFLQDPTFNNLIADSIHVVANGQSSPSIEFASLYLAALEIGFEVGFTAASQIATKQTLDTVAA